MVNIRVFFSPLNGQFCSGSDFKLTFQAFVTFFGKKGYKSVFCAKNVDL